MANYRLSPLAENDLEDIWFYTFEQWSSPQADRYYANIVAVLEGLATGKRKGRAVEVRENYLKYSVGSHFVFYRTSDIGIDIIRILHQKMDADRHL